MISGPISKRGRVQEKHLRVIRYGEIMPICISVGKLSETLENVYPILANFRILFRRYSFAQSIRL